jgi:acetate kinase
VAVLSGGGRILAVNAGTSSLKLRLLDRRDAVVGSLDLPPVGTPDAVAGLERCVRENGPIGAVGHRLVHGGRDLRGSVLITDAIVVQLRAAAELAPLHLPPALEALATTRRLLPDVPQVACFDTAFHATIPEAAALYAVPTEWTERWGIRRYGFHGLSHSYVSRRAAELIGRPVEGLRLVSCHLGAGASLAAVVDGRSVDTTMGFTPLEGLVMATRSGSVDPGALLWLQRHAGISAERMADDLERRSGLLGLAGSPDMREVLRAADRRDAAATRALEVYLHRLRQGIASMAASLGGIDAIAFAGGVGEGSARIRREACEGLAFLGVAIDKELNDRARTTDADLSVPRSAVRIVLVHTREDAEIAREVRRTLAAND